MRLALALLLSVSGCGAATSELDPVAAESARVAITGVLDAWHLAAAEAHEADYFGHFTDDAIFLGTDATERWTVPQFRAYAHPFFERGRAWTMRAIRRDIALSEAGDLAWFDEDLETARLGPARGSGVLRRVGPGVWKIAHYNLALTIPNDQFDDVRAALVGTTEVIPISLQSIDLCTAMGHHGYSSLVVSLRPSCGERRPTCDARVDAGTLAVTLVVDEAAAATCEEPGPVQATCVLPATPDPQARPGTYPNGVSSLPHDADVPVRLGDEVVATLRTDAHGNVAPGICLEPLPAARFARGS